MENVERFDIKIKTKNVDINVKQLFKKPAMDLVESVLRDNPEDEYIQENLPSYKFFWIYEYKLRRQ